MLCFHSNLCMLRSHGDLCVLRPHGDNLCVLRSHRDPGGPDCNWCDSAVWVNHGDGDCVIIHIHLWSAELYMCIPTIYMWNFHESPNTFFLTLVEFDCTVRFSKTLKVCFLHSRQVLFLRFLKKIQTRHVFVKLGCPQRQQSQNMAKSPSPKFLPLTPSQGQVMSVKCEQPLDELTVQVW